MGTETLDGRFGLHTHIIYTYWLNINKLEASTSLYRLERVVYSQIHIYSSTPKITTIEGNITDKQTMYYHIKREPKAST